MPSNDFIEMLDHLISENKKVLQEIKARSENKSREKLALGPQLSSDSNKARNVAKQDSSMDQGQQIALDSAPFAKMDRRKLLQYTYLLQEDTSNQVQLRQPVATTAPEQMKDSDSNHSMKSNDNNKNGNINNEQQDEFMSMESGGSHHDEDDKQGQIT